MRDVAYLYRSIVQPQWIMSCVILVLAIYFDAQHHVYRPPTSILTDYVRPAALQFAPFAIVEYFQSAVAIGIACGCSALFYPRIHIVHCIVRVIRVLCIYSVSFPNPYPDCPSVRQRCNDLLPSGHVSTFVSMAVGTDNWLFSLGMYSWAAMQSHQALYHRHHYSVDVILAFVLPFLVNKWVCNWHWIPVGIHRVNFRTMRPASFVHST